MYGLCNLFVLFSVLDSSHIDRTCTPFGGAGSVGQGDTNTPNYIKSSESEFCEFAVVCWSVTIILVLKKGIKAVLSVQEHSCNSNRNSINDNNLL